VTATFTPRGDERSRRSRTARVVVLFCVLVTGAFILVGQESIVAGVRAGTSSTETLLYAPAVFVALAALVGLDALLSAWRRRFFSGRAILQVIAALVLASYVGTSAWREYMARREPALVTTDGLHSLLRSPDARVRALVVEVAARRDRADPALIAILRAGLDDKDPLVWRTVLATRFADAHLDQNDEESARKQARAALDEEAAENEAHE